MVAGGRFRRLRVVLRKRSDEQPTQQDQRRELESELAKLNRFQGGKTLRKNGSGFGLRGPVPPKYRNPQNPEETRAGRGLRPKWLTAAIKGGKSADDFLIRGAVLSKKAAKPKRARKARK